MHQVDFSELRKTRQGKGVSPWSHRAHTQNMLLKLELDRVQLDSGKLSIVDMSLDQLNKITLPIQTLLISFGPSEYVEKTQI